MKTERLTVALIGNPNSGKTTLFNNLTGSHQSVGNWPGVTVEKKEGLCRFEGKDINVVDLPGIYSLKSYSPDELIAQEFILKDKPDVVVNIVNATNLERNLYLTVQLLEMAAPLVVALNMMDEAESRGLEIDVLALSNALKVPVVPMVATRNRGMSELLRTTVGQTHNLASDFKLYYGEEIESEITKLEKLLLGHPLANKYPGRWLAIKLLANDSWVKSLFQQEKDVEILKQAEESREHLKRIYNEDAEVIIADTIYGFINALLKDAVKKPLTERRAISEEIDRVLLNRWLGIPLLILIMFGVFQLIFALSRPFTDWMNELFTWLGVLAGGVSPVWLSSLISDGIIAGVGSVITFVPTIFLLFIVISFLEDSGYMARAAFITDKVMHRLGLHGRSFIPMILGFGCSGPGLLACRTIEDPKDRLATLLVIPFITCPARLPVIIILAGTFFPGNEGVVIFLGYLLSTSVALLMAWLLRRTLFKGPSSHFVMELPPYRLPTFSSVLVHTWQRGKHFLTRAGTVILGVVFLVWLAGSLPWGVPYASADSLIGKIGGFIAPIFQPAGFGEWQASASLIFGVLAKEVIVGTMGAIFGVEGGNLGATIGSSLGWSSLNAASFLVFSLLYTPCAASIATLRLETGSWKWTLFTMLYTALVAWILATLVFQIGSIFVTV